MRHAPLHLPDLCKRGGLGDLPRREPLELAALKEPAPLRPLVINRALRTTMSRAGLLDIVVLVPALQLEADRHQLLRGIPGLQPHGVKHHPVAAKATGGAEPRRGGIRGGAHP